MRHFKHLASASAFLLLAACASHPETEANPTPTAAPAAAPVEPVAEARPKDSPELSVYFGLGETRLAERVLPDLRALAEQLKKQPKARVVLKGYTDDLGSASVNLAIASRRVESVAAALASMGIPRSQIRAMPLGRDQTQGSCRNAACREHLRRVELFLQ